MNITQAWKQQKLVEVKKSGTSCEDWDNTEICHCSKKP